MRKKLELFEKDVKLTLTAQQKGYKLNLKLLKMFGKYYKKVWLYVFITVLTMIITSGAAVLLSIFSGNLLSAFSENFVYQEAIKWGIYVFATGAIISLSTWICNVFWQKTNFGIYILMKNDIMDRLNEIDQSYLDGIDALKFLQRIDWDGNNAVNKIFNMLNIFVNTVSGLAFLSYTLYLNLWVGLFLFGYVLSFAIIKYFHNRLRVKNRMAIKSYAYRTNTIQVDNIRGMKDLRGINANSSIVKMQETATRHRWSMNYKNTKHNERFVFGANILVNIYDFVFLILCAFLIAKGQLFIAGFMIAYNYKGQIITLAGQIATFKDELNDCLYSAKWVNQLFDDRSFPREKFGDKTLENVRGEIEFKNVKFEYLLNMPVLNDISFKIEPKTIVSIVGESGGGKSTIVSLLNKVYTLGKGQGEILIDGVNINELTKDSIRNNICVVSQSPYMFDMTIEQNLRLAKPDAIEEELIEALRKAKIYDFVSRLKDKMQTLLGDNGIKLSEGQRQRLAIARALLKNSSILVFDEATSSLDNDNQLKIKKIIKSLKKDHTIIMVAHRLSTVADSNNILFIKEGRVFAQGSHEELKENCEEYREMCLAEEGNSDNNE